MSAQKRFQDNILFIFLSILAVLYMTPILIVLMNSFKGRFFISDAPFAPNADVQRVEKYFPHIGTDLQHRAFAYITAFLLQLSCCRSMTAWHHAQNQSRFHIFFSGFHDRSFQMVMFTMSSLANIMHLDNPAGIIVITTWGLSVTSLYCGLIKHPIEI
jgi:raffinose/stachyose/melibiose transport system permease protein